MADTQISNPIAKAVASVGAATGAQVVESVQSATSIFSDLFVLNWANIASALAALYVLSQLCEWWWRKFWRPIFERKGWVKPRPRRYRYEDSDNTPLV
jgi:hypothetical protein